MESCVIATRFLSQKDLSDRAKRGQNPQLCLFPFQSLALSRGSLAALVSSRQDLPSVNTDSALTDCASIELVCLLRFSARASSVSFRTADTVLVSPGAPCFGSQTAGQHAHMTLQTFRLSKVRQETCAKLPRALSPPQLYTSSPQQRAGAARALLLTANLVLRAGLSAESEPSSQHKPCSRNCTACT